MSAPAQVPTAAQWLAEVMPQLASERQFRSGRIDRFGRVVGVGEFKGPKIPEQHQTHRYDDAGRCLLLEKHSHGGAKPTRRLYRYQDFQVTESLWLDADGRIENYHRYAYDLSTGLLAWRAEYGVDGTLFYAIASIYDEAGRLASETWTDAAGNRVKKLTYRYDKAGEIVAEERTDSAGKPIGTLEIAYDKAGKVVERSWKGPDGKRRSRLRFTYDLSGRICRTDSFGAADKLKLRQETAYDAAGNVVSERWLDARGKVFRESRPDIL